MIAIGTSVLRRAPLPDHANPDTVASLIRYPWEVGGGAPIGSLAEAWKSLTEVPVLGVVGPGGELCGLLSSNRFWSALARPYGWDVLRKKPVSELVEAAKVFSGEEPLLLLTENLLGSPGTGDQVFYAVTDSRGRYLGIFSQQDLVNYLAGTTQRDLATAQALQGQLVKRDWTVDEGRIWAQGICEMFKGVGGDFSTLRPLPGNRWFGCVCDVSGKGIAASLVTTLLWGVVETVDLDQPLAATIGRVNSAVCKAFQGEKFVSGFFWTYDEANGALTFADMGHSHQIFWTDGELNPCPDSPNLPLGIDDVLEIVTETRNLGPGDGLLVYSDGVVENVWQTQSDFPLEGILATLMATGPEVPARTLVERLGTEMARFRKSFPVHDDVTLVWFQNKTRPL